MPKVYVTLTTIPSRLHSTVHNGPREVIESLCQQTYPDYEIHFNIPNDYALHEKTYGDLPPWIAELQEKYPHLKIFRVEDVGPITKIVPTLHRIQDPDAILIVVDDDLIYHPKMVEEHLRRREEYPDCALGYDGLDVKHPPVFNDIRDHFCGSIYKDAEVKTLQHYKSVSYLRKFFKEDFFTDFAFKTNSDDIAVSCYMEKEGIRKFALNYKDEPQLVDIEEWRIYGGVVSFPIIRPSSMAGGDGCQDPKYGLRFNIPQEFIDKRLI